MIIRNGNLILKAQQNVKQIIDLVEQQVENKIGAIYKGTQLVWLTVYDAIKGCFNSGVWLGEKLWHGDHTWKNS